MPYVSTVLNQLQQLLPLDEFDSFVGQHEADKWVKHFTTKNQLTVMLYAQAKEKSSLRDIETGLKTQGSKWYHLGLEGVSKSTLARTNHNRPYDIFESLFYELLKKCQNFSSGTASAFNFKNDLYALDSTTINLRPRGPSSFIPYSMYALKFLNSSLNQMGKPVTSTWLVTLNSISWLKEVS